jgi:hypothetical protein
VTELDTAGRPIAGRKVSVHDICATVVDLATGPVACAYPAGHTGLHSWADLPGAKSSRPPGGKGSERTASARATKARK